MQEEGTFVWNSGRQLATEIEAKWKSGAQIGPLAQESDCAVIFTQELRDHQCYKECAFVCEEIAGEINSIY